MPIELIIGPANSNKKERPGYINPGFAFVAIDGEEVVSIHCLPDDEGGEVYVFPVEEFATKVPNKVSYDGDDHIGNKVEDLDEYTIYERVITDESGNRKIITARHIASMEIARGVFSSPN